MIKPSSYKTVIGITGAGGSGKDTAASIFESHGYEHVSSSNCVRDEIKKRGLVANRAIQTSIADELRKSQPEYWVDRALGQTVTAAESVVISGIYAPCEGNYIKQVLGGILVGVIVSEKSEDDFKVRFERLSQRKEGTRDMITLNDFRAAQARESSGIEEYQTNITKLISMSDFKIVNDGNLLQLEASVNDVILRIEDMS